MESSENSATTKSISKSLTRKRHNYENEFPLIIPFKKVYFNGPYQLQNWSLPDSIIYYITQKPSSSKGYQKLIQCCKYFFNRNPIIVLTELSNGQIWSAHFNKYEVYPFQWMGKIWLTDKLSITPFEPFNPNVASSIVSKFYQLDIKELILTNQILTYKQFMLLASNTEIMSLRSVNIKTDDDSVFTVEKLVEAFPKVKKIEYDIRAFVSTEVFNANKVMFMDVRKTVTTETMKELLKIPHFSKINKFGIFGMNETFDIETFGIYMKKNMHTKFNLIFDNSLSQAYKSRVEAVVDEVLKADPSEYRLPNIYLPGISAEKRTKMFRLPAQYD